MAVFKLNHMGNNYDIAIGHYTNTQYQVGTQFNMTYSASMFPDLLTEWTDTPMSNQALFLYGDDPGSVYGDVILADFAPRVNQAWKMFFYNNIDPAYNTKRMKLSYNGNFVNPKNGNYFNVYSPGDHTMAFRVYDQNNTLLYTSSQFMINDGVPVNHIADFISWSDFEAFVNAPTAVDAREYFYVLHWWFAINGQNNTAVCGFTINHWEVLSDMFWWLFSGVDPSTDPDEDPYSGDDSPYNPADVGGGDGDGDDPYDPGDDIDYPDDPPISIADTGMMSVYIPSSVQLNLLSSYLWSNNFVTSLVKEVYADPMDVIISLGFLPFNIPAESTPVNIKVGDRDSQVSSNVPAEKYHNLDCGSVALKTTIGAYIDYAPYTKADIFIPFVGFVPLDVDAFMGHSVGLKYKVEICTGSGIAFLLRDGKVWQTFACNLMTPIPISSANYSQMWQTVVGATAALAGAGAVGAAGMGAAAGAGEMAEGAQSISAMSGNAAKASSGIMSAAATKPTIQKSNNVSVMVGIMGSRKPFIQLHRPNLMLPNDQKDFQGYPSYIETPLSALTGYTRVSSINLAVSGATAQELKLIDATLKTGFIIGSGTNLTGSSTDIVLGRSASPAHMIGKTVASVATLTGTYRDQVDIMSPVIRIERDNPADFDYVYIPAFGRYYFVDDITIVRNGMLEIKLSVDVLESFKTGILANSAIIDKQAGKYNLYLNDDSIKMRQDPLVTCLEFPSGVFDNDSYEFVLCVAGG